MAATRIKIELIGSKCPEHRSFSTWVSAPSSSVCRHSIQSILHRNKTRSRAHHLGLAVRLKLKHDGAHDEIVRWSHVEFDAGNETIGTRKAMAAAFAKAYWVEWCGRKLGAPLPLAGEVGAKRRVRAFSSGGLSRRGDTLAPTLPRRRGRERTSFAVTLLPN
jgi:hypothetical protein